MENNRGVWESVIAFGNDGVVVRNNKQELGDIVTAYQQPRGSLTPMTKVLFVAFGCEWSFLLWLG